jgi:hypothetical protein
VFTGTLPKWLASPLRGSGRDPDTSTQAGRRGCSRKKRSISREASGPALSV